MLRLLAVILAALALLVAPASFAAAPDERPLEPLVDALRLSLRPDPVPIVVGPALQRGRAEVGLGLPLGEHVRLGPGVQLRYRSDPASAGTEVDAVPSAGIELRF